MAGRKRRTKTPPEVTFAPGVEADLHDAFMNMDETTSRALVSAAIEIADERADALRRIRDALMARDDALAVKLMCEHVNITEDTRIRK